MNLTGVLAELAAAVETIDLLKGRAHPFWPDNVAPPTAVVGLPDPEDIELEISYQRGAWRMTVPIVVVDGRVSDRAAALNIGEYVSTDTPLSIKTAVEDYDLYSQIDSVMVTTAGFSVYTIARVDYIAAELEVDVLGSG